MIPKKNSLIQDSHWKHGTNGINRFEKEINILLTQCQVPDKGWAEEQTLFLLRYFSLMDCNNQIGNVGVGEREGRVLIQSIRERCFGMTHGIGRSGDISADQPKAPGSSYLYKLTNKMVTNFLRSVCSMKCIRRSLVLPMCTGMALSHAFLTLQAQKENHTKKYVILSQIDQQTCIKCILYVGMIPILVPLKQHSGNLQLEGKEEELHVGKFLVTNIEGTKVLFEELGVENILCYVSTVSCFSPRIPDSIDEISRLCYNFEVPHIINMAYALQSNATCKNIQSVLENSKARIDAVVFSTDKNFLVPVGGSVIASSEKEFVRKASQIYPGRASFYPIQDLFISLVTHGKSGFRMLYTNRENILHIFQAQIRAFAIMKGEKVYISAKNDISFSMSLIHIKDDRKRTQIGAEIFSRGITGARVIVFDNKEKRIGSYIFRNYGSHQSEYWSDLYEIPLSVAEQQKTNELHCEKVPYLTVACAIGMQEKEVTRFMHVLCEIYEKYQSVSM